MWARLPAAETRAGRHRRARTGEGAGGRARQAHWHTAAPRRAWQARIGPGRHSDRARMSKNRMKYHQSVCGSVLMALALNAGAIEAPIEISKFAFTPKEISVTPGTKIIWT